jgi:hypothetical protein
MAAAKRSRAEYMRAYRAKQRGEEPPADAGEPAEEPRVLTAADMPDDATIKLELKLALLQMVRDATKPKWLSHECEYLPAYNGKGRGKKHQIKIEIPDITARVSAAKELLNRLEGTPGVRKHAPRPVETGRKLEEMTDEELEALTLEVPDGEVDGGAAEETAG